MLKLTRLGFRVFQHGGDINATDHTGQTALHWSAVRGAIQVAELLLQEGARVDATDMYGYQVHLLFNYFCDSRQIVNCSQIHLAWVLISF